MSQTRTKAIVEVFARIVREGPAKAASDGELLTAFVHERDMSAFAELVRRHGAMVFGVCLRVLRQRQDAEDAFQATFVVLARKAASVAPRALVGNWLYGVALQTAIRARSLAMKRRQREAVMPDVPEPAMKHEAGWDDVATLLDEELGRLPGHYRAVVVLCDVEGRSRKDAALHLGCPEGSVSSRLSRARAMLARRLATRGVTLSTGALALLVEQNALSAGMPSALVHPTVQAAEWVAAGSAIGGMSPAVLTLAEGVMKAMFISKLKTSAAAVMLAVVALGLGVAALRHDAAAGQHGDRAKAAAVEPLKVAPPAPKEERVMGTRPPIFYTLRKWDAEALTLSVSLLGTSSISEPLQVSPRARIRFSVGFGSPGVLADGKLSDLGLEGTPLLLEFAPDGKTVTGITAHLSLPSPIILNEAEAKERTISGVSLIRDIRSSRVPVPEDALVYINGEKRSLADLRRDMTAFLHFDFDAEKIKARGAMLPERVGGLRFPKLRDYASFISMIEAFSPQVEGKLGKVDVDALTLAFTPIETKLVLEKIPVAAHAKITIGGKPGRLADLKPGVKAVLEFRGTDDAQGDRQIIGIVADNETTWGNPAGGLQAGLRITGGHGRRLKHSEQIQFDIVVRNLTDRDITFTEQQGKRFILREPDVNNIVKVDWMVLYSGPGPLEFPHVVGAGGEQRIGSFGIYNLSDPKRTDSLPPGRYRVGAENVLMSVKGAAGNPVVGTGYVEIELLK